MKNTHPFISSFLKKTAFLIPFISFSLLLKGQSFKYNTLEIYFCTFDNSPNTLYKLKESNQGIGITYKNILIKNFDFISSLQGLFFSGNSRQTLRQSNQPAFDLSSGLRWKLLRVNSKVQPYLYGGTGIINYHSKTGFIIPVGTGIEFKITKRSFINLSLYYRHSFLNNLQPHFLFSAGIAGVIKSHENQKKQTPVAAHITTDRDGDGIPDSTDVCPLLPGIPLFKGCPDTDSDGITDHLDNCPHTYGKIAYNGCPAPDTDGDGITDDLDSCRLVPGNVKNNGCPEPDFDRDGIIDIEDHCPEIPGIHEFFGCPRISNNLILEISKVAKEILFETGSATLLKSSYRPLSNLVLILKKDSMIQIQINGHTDNIGKPLDNLLLSEKRAESVIKHLIKNGISKHRLFSKGYGDSKPKTSNTSVLGRKQNRRVEIIPFY